MFRKNGIPHKGVPGVALTWMSWSDDVQEERYTPQGGTWCRADMDVMER